MKKLFSYLIILISIVNAKADNLTALFSYCAFEAPGQSPYIETYLSVIGNTVKLVPSAKNFRKGEIEVQWIIRSGEKVVHLDKYFLISPDISVSDSMIPDFVDQQRIPLQKGSYNVELTIRDKNSATKETTLKQNINISYPEDTITISDIELASSITKTISPGKFTKSGYDIIPTVDVFYPKDISKLSFYAEVYRSDIMPSEDYLLRYYLSNKEHHELLDSYVVSRKQSPKKINVVIGEFDISQLESGNYNLNIEIRNKLNSVIAFRQIFFQRSNNIIKQIKSEDVSSIEISNTFVSNITNQDTLIDYLACLYPISSGNEAEYAENQINVHDTQSMQKFLLYFWRVRNADNPGQAWENYHQEVIKVNKSYGTRNRKGYETDHGRVYLQYGPPNMVSDGSTDPTAYPYEIWQYYKLNKQSNRKFVFYATNNSTNDYRLLHSDAKGEVSTPNWEVLLHSRTQQFGNDLDREKPIDHYGSHTDDNFTNPH